MASAVFSNVVQTLQSDILSVLKADTTSLTVTYADDTTWTFSLSELNIVDGMPTNLLKGTGFPYIIVHTPTERTFKKTLIDKFQSDLEIQIEVYDRREKNVRILIDAIRDSLQRNIATWVGRDMKLIPMTSGGIRTTNPVASYLPNDQTKPVWYMSLFAPFKWLGIE